MDACVADFVNGFPVNAIRVGEGVVLINVFRLDRDLAEAFVATQVGEYKRLQGLFPGSITGASPAVVNWQNPRQSFRTGPNNGDLFHGLLP
jgi:hypothetical protein